MTDLCTVKAWRDKIIIPTYEVGEPGKHPIFLDRRVYQGSSGAVYPHPVIEHISDEKTDKEWDVIYIENSYIKIMVLPALGGRVQMAYDKIHQRHFVYYNHVIKPALVGLAGPWISGGIEFNWPQHHRPSTYEPIDCYIEKNLDGSKTVWVSELERMFRCKGMAGFTLYPDKAYLEIKVQLYNRTPHPQTFLWWANPAVSVNEQYQSVFPPDVNAVFDHGKRDVSEFPIAKGTYYKVDYAPGTDISRYKNIPVPTSYMAISSEYDFVGGYENDTKGGLLHVADHHISPGKKQWTWGNGDFGHAWDRNLTDNDGPYIELMCGVYTDNQPDFSWIHPYEEKRFRQYFMPYYNVGVVKNATKEALVNLELNNDKATIKVYVTSVYKDCQIRLHGDDKVILNEKLDLNPATDYENTLIIGKINPHSLKIDVKDKEGNMLVSWCMGKPSIRKIPEPAKPAKEPVDIESIEQLFLTGLHLEQYRHATFNPIAYYLEALSREPSDVRNNNAMGRWHLKRGQFEKALPYFNAAIETLTWKNPNPNDGELFFNKGLVLNYLGRTDEAYSSFYKSCWSAAWQDAGYVHLAQIDCSRGDYNKALELVDKSLIKNLLNHKARHLKVIILRKLGETQEAKKLIEDSLVIDKFNFGILFEKYLLSGLEIDLNTFKERIRDNVHNYIEFSLDYAQAGQWENAIQLIVIHVYGKSKVYPMAYYFLGWYNECTGDLEAAKNNYSVAQEMSSDYCFPNKLEEVVVLEAAIDTNPNDAKALYYLGNFWYASSQYDEAKVCWTASIKIDAYFSITYRNLALLYFNKENNKEAALKMLERAFALDNGDARILMELDQLYKKLNRPIDIRLKLLEDHLQLTLSRDDTYLERINLYNNLGENDRALQLINERKFHPWEGGEGKVPFQYITANIELAKQYFQNKNYAKAIPYLEAAKTYPHNLGEGKLFGAQENDIFYWLGCVYEGLNNMDKAKLNWEKASAGNSDPSPAMFYNDQAPDKIFYQGLALLKLGKEEIAKMRFDKLIFFGEQHMNDNVKIDYFAVSLPDLLIWDEDLNYRNKIHCHYLIGLGKLGHQQMNKAIMEFDKVLQYDQYHLPAIIHKKLAKMSS